MLSYKIHISSDSYANTQSQVKSDISTEGFCSSTLICNSWVSELAKIPQLCITSKITSQALDILTLLLLCSLGEQSVFYVWPINVRNAFFLPYFTMALVLHHPTRSVNFLFIFQVCFTFLLLGSHFLPLWSRLEAPLCSSSIRLPLTLRTQLSVCFSWSMFSSVPWMFSVSSQ